MPIPAWHFPQATAIAAVADAARQLGITQAEGALLPAQKVERLSAWIGILQRVRIHVYLIYSFATLILLLAFAR